jgi:hypothetical protein
MADVTAAAAMHRDAPPFSDEQKRYVWSVRKRKLRWLHDPLLKFRREIRAALAVVPVPGDWVNKFWASFAAEWFDAEACEFAAFGPTGVELSRWLEDESKEMYRWLDNPSKRQTERLRDLGVLEAPVKAKIAERVAYWINDRCSKRSFAKRVGKYVQQNWLAQARLARTALEGVALESQRVASADDINREIADATWRLALGFLDSELDALLAEGALESDNACRDIAENAGAAILGELKSACRQPWFVGPLRPSVADDWRPAPNAFQQSVSLAQIQACAKQFPPAGVLSGTRAAGGRIPTTPEIKVAFDKGGRLAAVLLWQQARRAKNLRASKKALYEEASQDKAEYYRWERGELPAGSRADRDIRKVLLTPMP